MPAAKGGKKYYAVTDINHGSVDDNGKNQTYAVAADGEVDQSKFSDDEWQALVDGGSVSTSPAGEREEMTAEEMVEQSVTDMAPKAASE